MSQPLNVTITKTRDGLHQYMQILSADSISVTIVLVSDQINLKDLRPARQKKGGKKP